MTIEVERSPTNCLRQLILPNYKFFPARITIKHWQLRDLVCVNSKSYAEVIYPCDKVVHSLDLSRGRDVPVAEFEFEPRCLQADQGVIAAGGVHDSRTSNSRRGLFAIANRQTNEKYCRDLGEFINNSITLYNEPSSTQLKAIVCNNDRTLYFLNIESSRFMVDSSMKLTSALNHATISPDRKTVVCCGDSSQVFVCNREDTSNNGWRLNNTIESGSDLGFSTAFHSSGIIFGVAFQDGMARLYDTRNLSRPLTEIHSSRPIELMGAFRCLKFSNGPEDLLFLSEQMGRVHVVDLRDFANHQVLLIPPSFESTDGSAGGGHNNTSTASRPSSSSSSSTNTTPASPIVRHYDDIMRQSQGSLSAFDIPITSVGTPAFLSNNPYSSADALSENALAPFPVVSSASTRVDTSLAPTHRYGRYGQSEFGVSGVAYSDFDGGSLVLGTDTGIGVWKVDGKARRTFPSYTMR